jgi:hypothetical protein
MSLVNELQDSAGSEDVLTVLRKTKRLASKLDRQDIADWLQAEQLGYAPEQTVSQYRMIANRLCYNTNGYIPAGYGMLAKGIQALPHCDLDMPMPVREPISTVLAWIDHGARGVYNVIAEGSESSELIRQAFQFNPMFADQLTFLFHLDSSQIKAIPEQIKDKVLDWALALERAGVTGEGMTFSKEEKQIGHSVTFNITDSMIGQLSNSGTNHRSV